MLSVEEYVDELVALVDPVEDVDTVSVLASIGRVLAREVVSGVDIPSFDNSAMDGYAVRFAEVASVPVTLRVVGDVAAGSAENPVAGVTECVRIMTGAALPTFADTVVPVEDTAPGDGEVTVLVAPPGVGRHVRSAGEDIRVGAEIAPGGATVTPGLAGALAAAGLVEVPVVRRPVVAVCATGDELVRNGSPLRRGQIHESNTVTVAGALASYGASVGRVDVVGDDATALAAWLDEVGQESDLVVLTGGASVGAYDVSRDVLRDRAHGTFRHVRVQPGKPQGWAVWTGTPVVSLPGNPVSAHVSCELFVQPMVDRLLGRPGTSWQVAVAETSWTSPEGRRQVVPVRIRTSDDGTLLVAPAHRAGSGSHLVTALAMADGYAVVAEDVTVVTAGDLVQARRL